jgi:hypothetical protein
MEHPLTNFVIEALRLTDLGRSAQPIPDSQLTDFMENAGRLEFLGDLIGRTRILNHCYSSLNDLTERYRESQARVKAVPPDHPGSNVKTIPPELVEEDELILLEIDSYLSLIYYEVTSVVRMLSQLGISIESATELKYMVKVRDRFLSHVQLSGVRRGQAGGWALPEHGMLNRDVVALSAWSAEALRALGPHAVGVGTPQWEAQRKANEQLILSNKPNEKFIPEEIARLRAAGVRECDLELALRQLGRLLADSALPIVESETNRAIRNFGFERWSE